MYYFKTTWKNYKGFPIRERFSAAWISMKCKQVCEPRLWSM